MGSAKPEEPAILYLKLVRTLVISELVEPPIGL
jgi:hypothetical protein